MLIPIIGDVGVYVCERKVGNNKATFSKIKLSLKGEIITCQNLLRFLL